jgi:SAM-dependent methyltransferase
MELLGDFLSSVGLFCPDDRTSLKLQDTSVSCSACGRQFPIHRGRIVELLPRAPRPIRPPVSPAYLHDYRMELRRSFEIDDAATAWGAPESVDHRWAKKRQRQADWSQRLLTDGYETASMSVADLSAGAGWHTLPLSTQFQFVLHCDLSADSLNYAFRRAEAHGSTNILFLRIDYLAPPFLANLDRAICLDTLIRGEGHERQLLGEILSCVKPPGFALVDLHNWWHNPLRRLGLLTNNFGDNQSYSRRQVERMLRVMAVDPVPEPFFSEFDPSAPWARLLSMLLPPTHLGYRLKPSEEMGKTERI